MNYRLKDSVRRIFVAAVSLLFGIVVGVILVTFITSGSDVVLSVRHMLDPKMPFPSPFYSSVPPSEVVGIAIWSGFFFAIPITTICFLFWLLLGRIGRQNFISAAVLGFFVTSVFWFVVENGASWDDSAQFGLAGAIAGLVTFFSSSRLRSALIARRAI